MTLPKTKPFSRFLASTQGNVAMMFALSAPLMCFGIAIAVDFSNASVARTKLNEAADAAALAALTPQMMQQTAGTNGPATLAAQAMWNARISGLTTTLRGTPTMTATISDNGTKRTATITYTANVNTIFGGVLNSIGGIPNSATMSVGGSSTAYASLPPNIDFYLLLDNSPSMALPATSAGITSMISLTSKQDSGNGCAFACHQAAVNSASSGDTLGNLCTDGSTPPFPACTTGSGTGKGSIATYNGYCTADPYCTSTINNKYSSYTAKSQMDNYALARNAKIPLRLDELSTGVTSLMTNANNYQTSGLWATPPVYRFAAYSMDSLWQIGTTNTLLMALTSSYQSGWSTGKSNFGVMQYYSNNNVCSTAACTAAGGVGDVATNYSNAMGDINTKMPTPGNGTNVSGDSPKEVLFLVTDGVEDQTASSCSRTMTGTRCQAPIDTSLCTTIKNRGIQIAVLYTEYLAVPTNSWYLSWISPFQSSIETNLQACASSSQMYIKASFGDDLGTALNKLFQASVSHATLSN